MAVNEKLLNIRIRGGMGRHGSISSPVRVEIFVKMHGFGISLELFDNAVGILGVIFGNPCFYARGIKDGHSGLRRVDGLTDGLRKIDQPFKNGLDIFKEILLKACDLGSIWDFAKPTEFPEVPGIVKENKKQGIGRDGKNALDNKGP